MLLAGIYRFGSPIRQKSAARLVDKTFWGRIPPTLCGEQKISGMTQRVCVREVGCIFVTHRDDEKHHAVRGVSDLIEDYEGEYARIEERGTK